MKKYKLSKKELEDFIVDNFYLWAGKDMGWKWSEDFTSWKSSKNLKNYFREVLKKRKDALK